MAVNKKNGKKTVTKGLTVPGSAYFGNYKVAAAVIGMVKYFGGKNEAYFDAGEVSFPLNIRERKAGDRFIPFGMKSFMKLQDYMVNEKIPKYKRETIPLVTDAKGNILWVAGYRADDRFKVRPETERVLHLKIKNIENSIKITFDAKRILRKYGIHSSTIQLENELVFYIYFMNSTKKKNEKNEV